MTSTDMGLEQRPLASGGRRRHGTGFWVGIILATVFGGGFLVLGIVFAGLIGLSIFALSLFPAAEGRLASTDRIQEVWVQGEGARKIAMVPLQGIIVESEPGLFGAANVVSDVSDFLRRAGEDESVSAVVLEVTSPGGEITGSDTLRERVLELRTKGKPVVAYCGSIATSGAYYVSCAADKILAHPTSVTGSIGVIMPLFDMHLLLQKIGVQDTGLTSGPHKDLGSPTKPMTDEGKAILEGIVLEMHERFIRVVDEGRAGLSLERVRELADGRIYTGEQALQNGLVDELGYLAAAIDSAKSLAGLTEAQVVRYERVVGFFDVMKRLAVRRMDPTVEVNLLGLSVQDRMLPMYLWLPGY